MINDFLLHLAWGLFVFVIFVLTCFAYFLISNYHGDKECKIYSELKTKNGVMLVGKSVVPTTYQGRDCLVWENKE